MMDVGHYRGAQAAFERALEHDPEAAYVRLEYAEFLGRLGRFGRSHEARMERLREAVRQAREAERVLGENPDSLRVLAETQLALATEDPQDPEPMAAAVAALERLRREETGDLRSLLQLGQIYLRQGEAAAAAEVFQEVVDSAPGYRPAYRMLAEALIQSGQLDRADDALRHVIEDEPDAEAARLALAEILAERGEHRQAAEVLRSAPEPLTTTEARSRLATELYLAGDLPGSLAALDSLLADTPDSRYLQLLRGLVLSAQARNEEALAALEPLIGEGPGEANLAVTVSELLLRQERDDEAVDLLLGTVERLDADGPASEAVDARLALARLYATLDRWPSVETTVSPLLAGDDARGITTLEARLLYADALAEQGRGDEALLTLDQERASQPVVQAKRAELLAKLGREGEAVQLLTAAAEGDAPESVLEIAEGLHRADRFQETVAPLQRYVRDSPDSAPGRFLLGAAQERAGDRPAAEETFQGLLSLRPDYHPALNYLGYMWIESEINLDRAVDMVRQAVDLDPDNGAYIDSLGWGYYKLGRYDEAREALERASRLVQDPTIYEHLGDVYAALGERAEARRAYRRAMALEADDPDAVARKLSELDGDGGELSERPVPQDRRQPRENR
jgi:predicted Zn-dependent protease